MNPNIFNSGSGSGSDNSSFLPADYLQNKIERRTNIIGLALFTVVITGVVGAFFVTNRQWKTVKAQQRTINAEYATEAKKIEQLQVLQAQEAEKIMKGNIINALVEPIPRSVLFSEIINRMPRDITLTEFELDGKREKVSRSKSSSHNLSKSRGKKSTKAKDDDKDPVSSIPPVPAYAYSLSITGVSSSDTVIADFASRLRDCPLLLNVDIRASGDATVDEVAVRQFTIVGTLDPSVNARHIDPQRLARGAFGEDGLAEAPSPEDLAELLKKQVAGVTNTIGTNSTSTQDSQDDLDSSEEQFTQVPDQSEATP